MDMRKSARESFDRFMSTRREQPRMLVSRSFPGNYGRIKHGTSSSIANKCCKRHTASAAVPKFFAFMVLRCVESFYAVFTNRAITSVIVTRPGYRRRHGADKCDLFAIISSSALSLVVAFDHRTTPSLARVQDSGHDPISCFGQVTTHNFYEQFMATPFGHRKALGSRTSRDRRRLRL